MYPPMGGAKGDINAIPFALVLKPNWTNTNPISNLVVKRLGGGSYYTGARMGTYT
jgi:hypothetical protein